MSETEQKPAQSLKVDFPQPERAPWFGGDLQTLRILRTLDRSGTERSAGRTANYLSDGGKLAARLTEGVLTCRLRSSYSLTGCGPPPMSWSRHGI